MIAGADEPATLSGFCQPMAKIAMAERSRAVRPGFSVVAAGVVAD